MKFPISSEQCELLLAFETAPSLAALAKELWRDPSVISRQLAALAAAAPVLEKDSGRWRLTLFGRQINHLSRSMATAQQRILEREGRLRLTSGALPTSDQDSVLLALGLQIGWDDPQWGARNNPQAEEHIAAVLAAWRRLGRAVIHCPHRSKRPFSPLREGSLGSDFKPEGKPLDGELVIGKHSNCAFVDTALGEHLQTLKCRALVVVGFSTNHCVDATVRVAVDLGYQVFVVADATAAFERHSWEGELIGAETLHQATLASLHQEYATVLGSDTLLAHLDTSGLAEGPE